MWETQTVSKGVTWLHFHFKDKQLFKANENINILKTKLNNSKIQFAFDDAEGDSVILTSQLAKRNQAIAAINGSFFDTKKGGAVDFIKINKTTLDTSKLTKNKIAEHQQSAILIQNNQISIAHATDSLDVGWERKLNADNVMVTGPLLIFDGKDAPLSKSAFNDNRHPRSCACITKDKYLILMVIDGRTPQSQGVSLPELRQLLGWLNCKDAVNLDGGGSTALYIEGQPEAGIVNMPCDNKLFDHLGERKVSNVLYLKKK